MEGVRDCAFIPVCAGGCTVAAYNELGSIDKPNCHKTAIQAGVVSMAHQAAADRSTSRSTRHSVSNPKEEP